MKQKKFTQKMKLLVVVIVSLLISQSGWAATIVGYTLNSGTTSNNATSGITDNYPSKGRVISLSGITGSVSSNGYACTGWNAAGSDAFVTSVFSAAGYIQLTGSFQMKAASNAPSGLKVQWSTNGTSSWTDADMKDAGGITVTQTALTTTLQTYNFSLPTSLNGASSLYIRWVQVSVGTFAGAVTMTAVSISGNVFAAPQTQASGIRIIAVTTHSIKINCTNGSGTNRIIKIRRDNNFSATPPVANDDVAGNTDYSGVGEQIIYNGIGSSVTVTTTPVTTEVFWFAVYEYNKMGSLTLYNTILPGESQDNEKKCQLETVINPTATNIRLVKATLGGTITPSVNTVSERGIIWSTTSPVDDSGNYIIESIDGTDGRASDGHGTFTLSCDNWPSDGTGITVPRGTTIFYKAYAVNGSGQIMSEEASFNNTPIFTGTGNWETPGRWNVNQIPGTTGDVPYVSGVDAGDSPVINGNCTLTSTNVVDNLTINSGKNLTINTSVGMNVVGTLTNNAGVSGILIKSSSSVANGSLKFANGSPSARVEMYSKANWNLSNPVNNKYKWQFFGIPVKTITAGNTFNLSNSYVREWDESSIGFFDAWVLAGDGSTTLYKNSGSTLDQNHGYELVQQSPTTYTFSGELLDTDFTQSLPYTSGVAFAGQHIFGNPFTAAINIADIQFGLTNTEKAVYLYNTGTFTDWSNAGGFSDPGNGPGQYTVSTPLTAGSGSVPSQIPTSGSFLVKSFGGTGSITIPKAGGLVANIDQQRIKKQNLSSALKVNTRIDLIGQKFSDRMWIFTDASCTRNFDNGWDGRKILGSSQVSQLYSIENDGNYQINAVNDMNDSYIGFQAGEDTQFKMVFNHENTDKIYGKIYLVDLLANKTIDITQNGTEYAFTANANDATKRFKIITQTTGTLNPTESSLKLKMFNTSEAIYIQNFTEKTATYMLYNASGKAIQTINVDPNSMITVNTNSLNSGIYIAKSETETEKATLRLIIR